MSADHLDRVPVVVAARLGRLLDLYGLDSLVRFDLGEEKARWAVWAGIVAWWLLAPLAVVGWILGGRDEPGRRRTRWWLTVPLAATLITAVLFYGQHASALHRSRRSSRWRRPASSSRGTAGGGVLVAHSCRDRPARRQARRAPSASWRRWRRSWWRSAGAPTRRSSPRWPITRWVTDRTPSRPCRRRWPEPSRRLAALAGEWGLRWTAVATDEMARAAYANDVDRCFHCKAELMDVLAPIAAAEGATVVLGVNVDDLGDHRPGQRAASAAGATFPLVTAGLAKADVRSASRRLGLRTWDKPAAACLASRVPYGTEVIGGRAVTRRAGRGRVRGLGFRQVRVRHYGDAARIEVELSELGGLIQVRDEVVAGVRAAGYRYVTVDLEGFRSGNLNR